MNNSSTRKIYKAYMASPDWQEVCLKFKKSKCELCHTTTRLTLHHLHYKTLTQETEEDLVTLCWICHQAMHINMTVNKRLRSPSNGLAKMIRRMRNGKKVSLFKKADFLRRRYIVCNGDINLPDIKYFLKEAIHFAFIERQPTTVATSH